MELMPVLPMTKLDFACLRTNRTGYLVALAFMVAYYAMKLPLPIVVFIYFLMTIVQGPLLFQKQELLNIDTLYGVLPLDGHHIVLGRYWTIYLHIPFALLPASALIALNSTLYAFRRIGSPSPSEWLLIMIIICSASALLLSLYIPVLFRLRYRQASWFMLIPLMLLFFVPYITALSASAFPGFPAIEILTELIIWFQTNLVPIALGTAAIASISIPLSYSISLKAHAAAKKQK